MGIKDKIYDMLNIFPRNGEMLNSLGRIVNEADILSGEMPTLINGKPQGTVFGSDAIVSMEKAQVSGKWDMGIDLAGADLVITTTGYAKITTDESTLEVGTGVSPTGAVKLQTRKRIRYEPGTPLFGKFTAAFPPLSASNGDYTMGIGLGDSGDGFYLAQRRREGALEYGFILMRGGVEVFTPLTGSLPPDPTDLNIYRIDAGYLGVAPTNIYWVDTAAEVFRRAHRQVYNQRVTSVKKPDLPAAIFVRNEGNTLNITLLNGSFEAGTVNGGAGFDPSVRKFAYERRFTGASGTNKLVFAFRNPVNSDMYDFIDINLAPTQRTFVNSIASQLLEVSMEGVGNNKIVGLALYALPQGGVTGGIFNRVDLGNSVLEVSTDATFNLLNARKLDNFTLNIPKTVAGLELLFPGEDAVFVYTTQSVDFDMRAFIKYQDLF